MDLLIANAFAQQAPAAPPGSAVGFVSLLPIIALFVLFYFILLRPQMKRVIESPIGDHDAEIGIERNQRPGDCFNDRFGKTSRPLNFVEAPLEGKLRVQVFTHQPVLYLTRLTKQVDELLAAVDVERQLGRLSVRLRHPAKLSPKAQGGACTIKSAARSSAAAQLMSAFASL